MIVNRQQKLLTSFGMVLAIAAVILLKKTHAPSPPLANKPSATLSSKAPAAPSGAQPDVSTIPPSASADPSPALNPKQQAFAQKLREALDSIPSKSDLQNLSSEEAHHTPAAILEAGRALGDVAEAIHEDSSLEPLALDFYRACARDDSKPDSVRALCLSDLQKRQNGTVEGVPERVQRLSQTLNF